MERRDERERKGRQRKRGKGIREADPMAMRATDVKRVCRDRVERTFHRDYHIIIAFKLPHSTHRRPVGRSVGLLVCRSIDWSVGRSVVRACYTLAACIPFPRRSTTTAAASSSSLPIFLSLFYTRMKRQTNVRMHACTHCTHPTRVFPEKRNGEGRRERKRAHAAAPRCAAPRRETKGL